MNISEGNPGFPPRPPFLHTTTAVDIPGGDRLLRAQRGVTSKLLKLLQQLLAFGDRSRCVGLRPPDHAILVEHESRAHVEAALVAENPVGLADRAVRPVIGKEREGNAAKLFGPDFQARNRVGADLKYLYVQLLEFIVVRTEPADLILSPAGESHRKKADDRRPTPEARERGFLVGIVRGKREIGRRSSCLQWHVSFSL